MNSKGFFYKLLFLLVLETLAFLSPTPAYADPQPPFELPQASELAKLKSAIIYTQKCPLYFELFPEDAPWHVANFKYLADKGFYKGLTFHFYDPGYIIQGGDPKGTGFGTPGYSIPAEFSGHKHIFGTLGMARRPDTFQDGGNPLNPERVSSGSQFHILLTEAPHMDRKYSIFGQLVNGADCLKSLRRGDKIEDVKVFVRVK